MTADEVLEFRIPRVTTLLGGASHLVSGDQPIPQYTLASAGRGWPTLAEHDVKSLALMAHDLWSYDKIWYMYIYRCMYCTWYMIYMIHDLDNMIRYTWYTLQTHTYICIHISFIVIVQRYIYINAYNIGMRVRMRIWYTITKIWYEIDWMWCMTYDDIIRYMAYGTCFPLFKCDIYIYMWWYNIYIYILLFIYILYVYIYAYMCLYLYTNIECI